MGLLSTLNKEQKEAVGLLQIGTFLEYFDLMIYIHMGVLLNDLFFPQTDPKTAALLGAFAFCSTFVFRPIGALLIGWLGDFYGRKSTIILTTILMSASCVIMASLPTYQQIGITAAWIMIICRIAQGMSSMGELIGAEIYIAESVSRPACYSTVASIAVVANLGIMAALGIATLTSVYMLNWRIAFWIGAFIALVGAVARTRLRETPDYLRVKRQKLTKVIDSINHSDSLESDETSEPHSPKLNEKLVPKTLFAYFCMHCGYPLTFYLAYLYFVPVLKETYGYSASDIIKQNFMLSLVFLVPYVTMAILSYRIHPMRILRFKVGFVISLMAILPLLIVNATTPTHLFLIQAALLIFSFDTVPGSVVLIYHLPILRRYRLATFLWASTRALMYIITSFGLIYAGEAFGPYGLWIVTIPIALAYLYGLLHFISLERRWGFYPKPTSQQNNKDLSYATS